MKRYIFYFLLSCLFFSCEEEDAISKAGYLELGVTKNVEVIAKSVDPSTQPLAVAICQTISGKEDTVKYYSDFEDMVGEKIALPVGNYSVKVATNRSEKSGFDKPSFAGVSDKVVIKQGETTKTSIECFLTNVKVTTEFTRPVKENFKSCVASIGNTESGFLLFGTDEGRAAYFLPGYLLVNLTIENKEGVTFKMSKLIENTKPREHYNFVFDLIPSGGSNSGLDFDIKIDTDPTNDEEHTVTIPLPETGYGQEAPVIRLIGENELGNGSTLIVKMGESQKLQMVLESNNIGLMEVLLSATSTQLQGEECKLPLLINVTRNESADILTKLGLQIPKMENNKAEYLLDFSQMITNLKVGDHHFMVMARDENGQESSFNFVVSIRAAIQMLDIPASSCWAKFAYLSGYIENANQDDSKRYKFEIKKKEDDTWIVPVGKDIVVDNEGNVSQVVVNLDDNTEYEARIVLDENIYSESKLFKTEEIVQIPNLTFDSWRQSGKMWYPNDDESNSYWATGNEGVTSSLAGGKDSNTYPSEDAVSGKAAKLVTIGNVTLVNCAAGNLFIGSYKTNASDKEKSVNFGREYTAARPTRLTGWYKYKSCPIDYKREPADLENDICNIYIWLQDANGNEIARGDFEKGETVGDVDKIGGYQLLNIDIIYSDKASKPAKMTIVATSSKYGGKFGDGLMGELEGSVGIGSTLVVDDFELLYEYEYSKPATK